MTPSKIFYRNIHCNSLVHLSPSAMYQKVMTHLHLYYDFKQISTPQPRVGFIVIRDFICEINLDQ